MTTEGVSSGFQEIRKRDGRLVPFDASKITAALLKAGRATGEFSEDMAKHLTIRVLDFAWATLKEPPTVEQIQSRVEFVLLDSPFSRTAKAYILYRDQHARIRRMLKQDGPELIRQYLEKLDWSVRENSNMGYSLQGLNNYLSSALTKTFWLNQIYTPAVRRVHEAGDLHIHDLAILAPYCVGWDLQDLLSVGFQGAGGKVQSRPARHFRTALGQMCNFFFTLQGEAAGAQAFAHADTLLAPFIRHDGLDFGEVRQALQEFVFNLNVPTRVGFQTPFTNLTLDLFPPARLAHEAVIIGGERKADTYGDYQREIAMFNRALLEVLAEGDAQGRPFTFPIPTYNIGPDFPWDASELSSLWEVTAKYGLPHFANFVASGISPDDAWSMCCNLHLDVRALEKRGGGLFAANPLTGSIGVVTINMPRIGYLSASEDEFFGRLDRLMELARTSLETKRKALEHFMDRGIYPYMRFYLRHIKQGTGRWWNNHFSTIGLVGMNEACLNFLGADIGTPDGLAFAERVLDRMRERISGFQQETGNMYNLEATPAESTAYRFASLDKKAYPDIQCANEDGVAAGAKPFYTNSSQLPVNYSDDIFRVLDLQDPLQTKYTGGTVLHVFLGEAAADTEALKRFVRTVCQSYRLPFFTITPTFSVCPSHGYLHGEQPHCPKCRGETEVYSRVVGYLRPVQQWNEGKQAEFRLRSKYRLGA